ncbi:MAG: hypothetical protein JJ913_00200 [Rhizobiaceae bacterium]|nr:hypothetical protein [Rhizobiaceae bacterium]
MDPVTLAFYGAVCGFLAAFVPRASRAFRFALGVGVGLIAASFLPPLRAALGL